MDNSTPTVNRNIRRQTLLKNATEASPLRRSLIQTPLALLENPDDEQERSSRRSHADIQRRVSIIPQVSTLNDSYTCLGEEEVKEHYRICLKLFSENKITAKNVWKLHIIDLLKRMVQTSSPDAFQIACTSLDIGAKVYAIRVDDIHSQAMKLMRSVARIVPELSPQGRDDSDEIDPDAEKENIVSKKKKRKRTQLLGKKNTILDAKAFQAPLPKLDPVFFSVRANAETGVIDNFLTNTLKMDNSGYKFMLMSEERAWPSHPDPLVKDINGPNCNRYPITIGPLSNVKLCAPFSEFELDEWDADEEERKFVAERSALTEMHNEVVFDDQGIPIPALDGSLHDIFANNHQEDDDVLIDMDDDILSVHEIVAPQIRGDIAHTMELRHADSELPRSEYTYNTIVKTDSGKCFDQMWAGPSHWKLKFLQRNAPRFSGRDVNDIRRPKQARNKAPPQMINYTEVYEEYDMSNKTKIKKKPPTGDYNKVTLPVPDKSCLKLMETAREYFCRPGVCYGRKKPVASHLRTSDSERTQVDYEVSAYKYENPTDADYCSQQNVDDNHDVDEEEHILPQHQEFLGDNLIDAPETVPQSYVPYALQPKKMDMKQLKSAIWKNLTQSETDLNVNAQQRSGAVVPTTFGKMYKELPEQLPAKMNKALSCPMAFVALLHLCNEENLELKQHPGNSDFDIKGPK